MSDFDKWESLKTWLKAYALFGKIDRHSGDQVLRLMDELEGGAKDVANIRL
jgi:hypothetical protein